MSQFLNNPKLSESAALAIRNMSDKSDAIKDIEMVKNHLLSSLTLQVCNYFLFSGWEQCKKIVWDLKEILLGYIFNQSLC